MKETTAMRARLEVVLSVLLLSGAASVATSTPASADTVTPYGTLSVASPGAGATVVRPYDGCFNIVVNLTGVIGSPPAPQSARVTAGLRRPDGSFATATSGSPALVQQTYSPTSTPPMVIELCAPANPEGVYTVVAAVTYDGDPTEYTVTSQFNWITPEYLWPVVPASGTFKATKIKRGVTYALTVAPMPPMTQAQKGGIVWTIRRQGERTKRVYMRPGTQQTVTAKFRKGTKKRTIKLFSGDTLVHSIRVKKVA